MPRGKIRKFYSQISRFGRRLREPYFIRTKRINDFEDNGIEGNNSPLNRPEFVDISVPGGDNNSDEIEEQQDGDEEDKG
jgi:hypothetical protein